MNRAAVRVGLAVAVVAAIAVAWLFWLRIAANPDVVLLRAYDGVAWIKPPSSPSLRIHHLGEFETTFETSFRVESVPAEAALELRALRDAEVYVNDRLALERRGELDAWKTPRTVDLAPYLRAGENVLRVDVYNVNAPRLLWARSDALGITTNTGWGDAVPAGDVQPSDLAARFTSPWRAFVRTLPLTLPVFVLVFAYAFAPRSHPVVARVGPWLAASRVRWYVIGAWIVLGVNNIVKIPMIVGFDIEGHINYIHYLTLHKRLPLADDGWQMFQSPLYYVLSAPLYALLREVFELDRVIQLLRVVPLLCGLAQVEIAYRTARHAFPNRNDLQAAATAFAGFLPMNLYISQYIGNEPLAGALSAGVCLICVRMLTRKAASTREVVALAIVLGLAILAKVTAILLIPLAAIVVAYVAWKSSESKTRRLITHGALFAAILAVVCGWYFARNWMHFGKPIIGGWEIARNIVWWQDPGYRTPGQFFTFGEALVRPITAGTAGLWDAFYATFSLDGLLSSIVEYEHRPPWNYAFVVAGAWWGLVPTLLVIAGGVYGLARRRPALLFAVASCALYLGVFAYLYLTLPVYSTGKATYTLGLTPIYTLLLAAGLGALRATSSRAIASGILAAWAAAAYAAYFVVG